MDLFENPDDEKNIIQLTDKISNLLEGNQIGIIMEAMTQVIAEIIVDNTDDEQYEVWCNSVKETVRKKVNEYKLEIDNETSQLTPNTKGC